MIKIIYNRVMKEIEIVLCSDNHGMREPLKYLKEHYSLHDYFLHCGDSEMSESEMDGFSSVQGNNDRYHAFPFEKTLKIGCHQILLTHGNRDMFFGHYEMLASKAKKLHCDIVCFGHTHVYCDMLIDGIRLLNPGSIWRNRDGSEPTYMLIHFNENQIEAQRKTYICTE